MPLTLTDREKEIFHKMSDVPVTAMELTGTYERQDAKAIRAVLHRLHAEGLVDKAYDPFIGGWRWWRA